MLQSGGRGILWNRRKSHSMKYYCNPKYCSVGEVRQWEKIRARNSDEQIKIIGDHVFCQNCW